MGPALALIARKLIAGIESRRSILKNSRKIECLRPGVFAPCFLEMSRECMGSKSDLFFPHFFAPKMLFFARTPGANEGAH